MENGAEIAEDFQRRRVDGIKHAQRKRRMSNGSTYSFSSGQIATAEALFRTLFRLHDVAKDGVIPAIVSDYSPRTHYVAVKPLVRFAENKVGEEGSDGVTVSFEDRPTYKVKTYQQRHGNFIIDFPLRKGDTGFLVAVDRNWSTARNANDKIFADGNAGPENPVTFETSSFANGIFYPFSFTNDKKHSVKPLPADIERTNRILEQPDSRTMIRVHNWEDLNEALLYTEIQHLPNGVESVDESGSESDDDLGTAGIVIGHSQVRIRGGGGEERPQSVWIGKDGTTVTNRVVVEGFPPNPAEKIEKHEPYEKVDGTMTFTKKATIDPVNDLRKSDAKFRPIYYLTVLNNDSDEQGESYSIDSESDYGDNVWLMRARVLSDIPVKIRKIHLAGGTAASDSDGGGCNCDSISISASGECSVVTDIEYESSYADSDIEPYTILVHKGKICVRTIKGNGRKLFQLFTSEDPDRLLKIPTVPISEVVYPWALRGNTDDVERGEYGEEPIESLRMYNSDGQKVTLTVIKNSYGENTIEIQQDEETQ